jgi:hypothetical protein
VGVVDEEIYVARLYEHGELCITMLITNSGSRWGELAGLKKCDAG